MKKVLFVIILAGFSLSICAQKPLATFFSEDGYKFWVIMDGKKMNAEPNYRIENIEMDNDWAKVKIIFENPGLKAVEKTIQGVDVDGNPSSVTWVIKETGKGKWKITASSWKPLNKPTSPETVTTTQTVVKPDETPAEVTHTTRTETTNVPQEGDLSVSTGTNTFSMKVNMDDGMGSSNMDINIAIPDLQVSQSEIAYTTITTSTTKTESRDEVVEQPAKKEKYNPLPGYNGRIGCENPMSSERFTSAGNSISTKSFEDSKLTVAKQIMNSNCLLVSQVKQIMQMFDFESTKLDFAKAAYSHTYDIDNYYELNDVFDFESSIRELNTFIQK